MPETRLRLEVAGRELPAADLADVLEVAVEEATDSADALTVTARLDAGATGAWRSVLDPLTVARTAVVLNLRNGDRDYRFVGETAQADWRIDPGMASRLTVQALDATHAMDREEKVVAHSGSDSSIVRGIFGAHGLNADVRDTPAGPDGDVHVVLQRGSDWAFVRSLARKWGYDAYVESGTGRGTGHFHPPTPLAGGQATLALGYGGAGGEVAVQVNLTGSQALRAVRLDPLRAAKVSGSDPGTGQAQGARSLGGQVTLLLAPDDVDGELDPQAAAEGLARNSAFTATLTTQVDVTATGLLLRARRPVTVAGLGPVLSGSWLVDRVRHVVTPAGHRAAVTLVRNALGVDGGRGGGSVLSPGVPGFGAPAGAR